MATKAEESQRVSDIRHEMEEAQTTATVQEDAFRAVLDMRAELRKQGLDKPGFNLESPYGYGIFHCDVEASDLGAASTSD